MSSYDKAYQVRKQQGMSIQAACNVRDKLNLSVWDDLPHKQVAAKYSKLLKAEIDKDKCKKSRRHI